MADWQHAVVAMTWIGVAVGSIEILLILALLLYACVSHGTCRPSQVFAVALERCEEHEEDSDLLPHPMEEACREDRTSWSMHVDALLRRLAKEEANARRFGRTRHAKFIAALGQRLELQLRDTAVARSRHHAEEQQLRAEERQLQVLRTTMPDSLPRANMTAWGLGLTGHWTIDWCSQSRSAQVDVARATWGISRESYPPRRWCSALPGASPPGQARVGPDEPADDALRCHSRTPACSPSGRVALRWARSERAARVAQQPGTAFSWRACRWGTVAVFTLAWVLFLVVAGVTVLRAT